MNKIQVVDERSYLVSESQSEITNSHRGLYIVHNNYGLNMKTVDHIVALPAVNGFDVVVICAGA